MLGFSKKAMSSLAVDIHSHLIPGVDDGVKTLEKSIEVIRKLSTIGFKKIITTPHIHPTYPNSTATILQGLDLVRDELQKEGMSVELEAAAEYFVDDVFIQKVKNKEKILSFGSNYVLVESSFQNKPLYFESCLFELQSRGYQPVLAHPERYRFLEGEIDWLSELKENGVLFQVTVSSFVGFYGEIPQKIAKKLYERNMIDFLGSDLHVYKQIKYLEEGLRNKMVKKLCSSPHLKNKSLI